MLGSDLLFRSLAAPALTDLRWDLGDYGTGKCLLSPSGVDYM